MINDTTIEKLCNSISGSQLFVARLPDSTYIHTLVSCTLLYNGDKPILNLDLYLVFIRFITK